MSRTIPSESALETAVGTLASAAMPAKVERGTTIGRYVVIDRLGAGAMGTVFAAFDPELDRKVAIKLLHPRSDEDAHALRREAQTLARLSHPNVVGVHDVGSFGDQLFLAMEFIDGTTLRAWNEGPLHTDAERLHALVQAGRGLAAAHSAGIVHRDFKPDNVLVRLHPGAREGRVCVADFGVAAHQEQESDDAGASTLRLRPVGTPAYMAPEQVLGEALDHRADQYAFCIVAFEVLAGARPFAGDDVIERATTDRTELPRDTPRAVSSRILRVLARGLERDPARRWPDMDALLSALVAAEHGHRRTFALVGGGVLLAATSFAAARWTSEDRKLCDATGTLASTWDDDVRERMRATFDESATSFAPVAFDHAARVLDAWALAWTAGRVDACEATRVRGEQSERQLELRMACLDRQRERVGAMVEVLALGERDVIERASTVLETVPDPEACRDVTRLDRGPAPPADPEVAREVDAVERELARVEALRKAGKIVTQLALDALDRARATEYEPTIVAAMLVLADSYYAEAQYEDAERHTSAAFEAALASGSDFVALEGATSMIAVQRQLGRYEEGRRWAAIALAMQRRASGDVQEEATIEANIALLAMDTGRLEEAILHAERSLELRLQLSDEDRRVGEAWMNVSATHTIAGRWARASEALQHAIAVFESTLGLEHPYTLTARNNAAIIEFNEGHIDEAVVLMRGVFEARRRVLPVAHPDTIDALSTLAMMEFAVSRFDEAIEQQDSAYELAMQGPTPRIGEAARIRGNRAIMALRVGDLVGADTFARESIELFGRLDAAPQRALALLVRGEIATARGLFDDARVYTQQAIEDARPMGENHLLAVGGRMQMAEIDAHFGRTDAARAAVDEILAKLDAIDMPARSRAELLFSAAKALDRSEPARAKALAEQAIATYSSVGDRVEHVRIEAWLAAR